jgi:N-acetylmuramoyl-L-alanine amidase
MPSIAEMYPTSLQSVASSGGKAVPSANKTVFRVQLAASTQNSNLKEGIWAAVKGVECLKIGTTYKFLIGRHSSLNTAVKEQEHWRANGFKGAFIVAFKNGQRISMTEAIH